MVAQEDFFDKDIVNDKNKNKYFVINKGDFVYNPRKSIQAPYGPINLLENYDSGIVSPLYTCFTVQKDYTTFLKWYFKSNKWHKYIYINGDKGARGDRVSIKDSVFYGLTFYAPYKSEMNKIDNFLSAIDEKINVLSMKISTLKKYKEGLIQQALKSTIKTPLNRLINESIDKTITNNQYVILSSTAKGIFLQSDFFNHQIASKNNTGYKILKEGQIVFSPQNLWLGNINLLEKYKIGCVSPSYKVFDINRKIIDSKYLIEIMKTKIFLHKYKLCSEQGASVVRRNLDLDQFLNIKVPIPSNNKFYNLLNKFSDLIEIESSILSIIISIKNYLLKNMFI